MKWKQKDKELMTFKPWTNLSHTHPDISCVFRWCWSAKTKNGTSSDQRLGRSGAPWTRLSPSIGSFGLIIAPHNTPPHPFIRLSVNTSLRAFFAETLGIFFPSTMLNTVLTSVLRWNWGVDSREGQPQRKQINGVFFYVLVCLTLFSLPSEEANWPTHLEILHSHLPKKGPLPFPPLGAHRGQYSNRWTQLKKDKYLMKKWRLQKILKM